MIFRFVFFKYIYLYIVDTWCSCAMCSNMCRAVLGGKSHTYSPQNPAASSPAPAVPEVDVQHNMSSQSTLEPTV